MADDPTSRLRDSLAAARGEGEPDARRAADALRRVAAWLVAAPAADRAAAAERVADEAERLAASLPGIIGRTRYDGTAAEGRARALARHPVIGAVNPVAPLVKVEVEGTGCAVEVTYDATFEGPPGCVHGGHIAAAFDVVLGFAAGAAGSPGLTGSLLVRYLRPTPLHEPLRYEAEIGEQDGKRLTVTGRLLAFEDVVTAEAEGVFVAQAGFEPGRFLSG